MEKNAARFLGQKRLLKLKKFLKGKGLGYHEGVVKEYGEDKLREAYKENLMTALSEVCKLVEKLPGKVILTADHGELLGENSMYRHPMWSDHPVLRDVPWLEIIEEKD